MIAALQGEPTGARPTSAGSARWGVPPRRRTSSCRQTSRPSRNSLNVWDVWNSHATSRCNTWRFAPVVEALQALRGVQGTVAVTTGAALGDLTRFDNPRQLHAFSGAHALGICPWGAASAGQFTKTGHTHARRALVAGAWASRSPATSQSAPATAPGKAPDRAPGHQLAGPGPPLHTVSPPDGHRQTCPSGRGRHCPGMACLSVGPCPANDGDTASIKTAAGLQPKRSKVLTSIGRDAAPVWCHPRRRYETDRSARPANEAGTRRRQGRWEPTHGEQRDQPSCFLAPALPRATRKKRSCGRKKVAPHP